MDDSTKPFFEKLANINSDDEPEFEPRLAKADISVSKNSKRVKKNLEKESVFAQTMADEEEKTVEELVPAEVGEFDDFEGQLTIDVYQTPTHIIVESTVAGVNPEDIDINITPDSVSIKGERRKTEKVKKEDYLFQECFWGKFSRSVILPQEIDPDKAQASVKNGILKITLPKLDKQKAKKLRVKFD